MVIIYIYIYTHICFCMNTHSITNLDHNPIIGSSQADLCRHMEPASGSSVQKMYII